MTPKWHCGYRTVILYSHFVVTFQTYINLGSQTYIAADTLTQAEQG